MRMHWRHLVLPLFLITASIAIASVTLARYTGTLGSVAPSPTTAPSPSPSPTPQPPPTPTPFPPSLSAQAVLLVEVASERILLARASERPLPPASTLKLLTALTVRDVLRPEEVVTIQPTDVVDPSVESAMGLAVGDTVTVHDLLIGLLLPSGNDAARALARAAGERLDGPADLPPAERFLRAMQAKARELGLQQTVVLTPDGDDVPGQVTSAADLARLGRLVLADPELAAIVAMREAEVRVGGPNARVLTLSNTNQLLGQLGVIGIKTGTTPEAGQCLVAAWRTEDNRVYLAVLLGSSDRYGELRALIDWVTAVTGSVPLP